MTTDLFADIDAQAKEFAEERAAVRQYDAGFTREEATRLGMLDSEEWRSACYVRHVQAMDLDRCLGFIEDVRKHQGEAGVVKLVAGLEPFERRQAIVADVRRRRGDKAAQDLIVALKKARGKV